ncbi:hypothetical protein RhiirA4_479843 [Rhizophagus irregularis]|uniref:Uncharacterized protein n=1 Tax=Rhizophagus irregularis TaxID=588596 RepID=A0A2I1HH65_9GLOM|nr:hypothetical protein RhiirA4_479843 [Rhizophagus irregularis]
MDRTAPWTFQNEVDAREQPISWALDQFSSFRWFSLETKTVFKAKTYLNNLIQTLSENITKTVPAGDNMLNKFIMGSSGLKPPTPIKELCF